MELRRDVCWFDKQKGDMLYILGLGHSHPDNKFDNKFLEDLEVGTTAEWIEEKIGIKTRHTSLSLDYIRTTRNQDPLKAKAAAYITTTGLAANAARMAIERAGIKPSDIGLIICNCCTPTYTAPAEAHRIAQELKSKAVAYDVFSACPAFALHIDYLRKYREDALPDYVLCISTATITQHVNYNDRTDGAIWSDGAAAWIVSSRHKGRLEIVDSTFMADPTRCTAVVVNNLGFFQQDGRAVRDFSVRQTVRLIKAIEETHNIDWTRDIFVGHQANRTMLDQIVNNREIPESNHWHNASDYGNQAGASAPTVLSMNWDRLRTGQRIVSAVVGAGLSWGSVVMKAV